MAKPMLERNTGPIIANGCARCMVSVSRMADSSSTSRPMRRVRLGPTLAMKRGARKQARMLSAALAVNQ
ncbi:hypothetical protein D3C84_848430 [compost metagenome]